MTRKAGKTGKAKTGGEGVEPPPPYWSSSVRGVIMLTVLMLGCLFHSIWAPVADLIAFVLLLWSLLRLRGALAGLRPHWQGCADLAWLGEECTLAILMQAPQGWAKNYRLAQEKTLR